MIGVLTTVAVAFALQLVLRRQVTAQTVLARMASIQSPRSAAALGEGVPVSARQGRRLRLRRVGRQQKTRGHARVVVVGLAIALVGGPLLLVAAAMSLVVVGRLRGWKRQRRAAAMVDRSVPEVFDLLTSLLRAGLSPALAFEELTAIAPAAVRPRFSQLMVRRRNGMRFADALTELGGELPALRSLCDTLSRAERYGDPIEPIIDRLGDEAQQRRRRQMETSARQLPVRLCFPLVCCTLPAFVLLAIVPLLAGALSSLRQSF